MGWLRGRGGHSVYAATNLCLQGTFVSHGVNFITWRSALDMADGEVLPYMADGECSPIYKYKQLVFSPLFHETNIDSFHV